MKLRAVLQLTIFILVVPCFANARKLAPEVEYAMGYGAEAKICLKVCDEAGLPVPNASVRAEFDLLPDPLFVNWNFFRRIEIKSDEN